MKWLARIEYAEPGSEEMQVGFVIIVADSTAHAIGIAATRPEFKEKQIEAIGLLGAFGDQMFDEEILGCGRFRNLH